VNLRVLVAGLLIAMSGGLMQAQVSGDVLGLHNLGPGSKSTTGTPSPISGSRPDPCAIVMHRTLARRWDFGIRS